MFRLGVASVLAFLLFLIPAAEAGTCRDSLGVEVASERASIFVSIAYFGPDAWDAREEIDAVVGNRDGSVSSREVERYEEKYTWDGHELPALCREKVSFLEIDGARAVGFTSVQKVMLDAEGPVREDVLWFGLKMILEYPRNDGAANVSVRLGDHEKFLAAIDCAVPSLRASSWADHVCGTRTGDAVAKPTHFFAAGGWRHKIVEESIEPEKARALYGNGEILAETLDEQAFVRANLLRFQVVREPTFLTPQVAQMAGGAFAAVLAFGAAFLLWGSELRYPLSRWLFALPLFSRFDRDSAGDHPRRQEVLAAVEAAPGISLNELGRRTEIPKGALTHHLRVLERHGLLTSRRERVWTRFFPPNFVRRRVAIVTTRQEDVTQLLVREPGLSQSDLASRLGLQRKAAQYHLDRLEEAGIVRSDRRGRRTLYFLPENNGPTPPGGSLQPPPA
jgi:DNA-binding transcriptional ArsR family regulator